MRRLLVVAFTLLLGLSLIGNSEAQIRKWSTGSMKPSVSRVFYPANTFHYVLAEGTPNTVVGASGAAIQAEISTLGLIGIPMTTADQVSSLIALPADLDKNYNLAWRVWWTSTSADDDGSIVWIVSSQEISQNSAIPTATTAGLADDVSMDADSTETQYGLEVTTWDTIPQASLASYSLEKLIALGVELDADGDAEGDEVHFLGVELAYISSMWGARDDSVAVPGSKVHGTNQGLYLKR